MRSCFEADQQHQKYKQTNKQCSISASSLNFDLGVAFLATNLACTCVMETSSDDNIDESPGVVTEREDEDSASGV